MKLLQEKGLKGGEAAKSSDTGREPSTESAISQTERTPLDHSIHTNFLLYRHILLLYQGDSKIISIPFHKLTMACPRRLSFSQFGVLMSRLNGEKDSLIGQTLQKFKICQAFLVSLVF